MQPGRARSTRGGAGTLQPAPGIGAPLGILLFFPTERQITIYYSPRDGSKRDVFIADIYWDTRWREED